MTIDFDVPEIAGVGISIRESLTEPIHVMLVTGQAYASAGIENTTIAEVPATQLPEMLKVVMQECLFGLADHLRTIANRIDEYLAT